MITRVRGGQQVELRAFTLSDMSRYGWTDSLSWNPLGEREMRGIPAINRAAEIKAQAIANLQLCCWSGYPPEKTKRDSVWQALFFAKARYNECQTRYDFWETIGESLAYRNKAFIWKNLDPISGRVLEWYALHPDQVQVRGERYLVTVTDDFVDPVGRGPGKYEKGPETVLFIRGFGQGGSYDPPTPVQVYRNALSGPIGRQRHEARMWRRGTALQVAIQFPQGVSASQAEEWRESWRSNYEGTEGETTAVIGGGADIKPIGMTAADAQFVEMAKLTVEDASRIMGVPANLLGVQLDRAVPNLEQDLTMFLRFGLQSTLKRIEAALEADFELFGGAQTYPEFDTQQFVRGDVVAEAEALHSYVQAGVLTPDEARSFIFGGMPPLPDGVGEIPQITPVGGAPNPNVVPSVSQNGSGYE